MANSMVTSVVAFPDWIVGVTRSRSLAGYICWVISPELEVLNDGEAYSTSSEALAAGRTLVQYSTGPQIDFSRCRLVD